MSRFQRPCLVCGVRTHGSYCVQHQQEVNSRRQASKDTPERLAKKRRLYGGDYARRRREVLATATHCHICKQPFVTGDRVDADHLIPNEPRSPLAASHASCNRSRGDKPLGQG